MSNPTTARSHDSETTPSLLTLAEVATRLRVSRAHLSKLARGIVPGTAPLPVVRLGRRVLVRRETLEQWLFALDNHQTFR